MWLVYCYFIVTRDSFHYVSHLCSYIHGVHFKWFLFISHVFKFFLHDSLYFAWSSFSNHSFIFEQIPFNPNIVRSRFKIHHSFYKRFSCSNDSRVHFSSSLDRRAYIVWKCAFVHLHPRDLMRAHGLTCVGGEMTWKRHSCIFLRDFPLSLWLDRIRKEYPGMSPKHCCPV